MALYQYDPLKVTGTWKPPNGDINILEGAVAADFASTAQDNMLWTQEADIRGDVTRVKNNIRTGTVQLTLSASSPTNQELFEAWQADLDQDGTPQVGILSLVDVSGGVTITAANAYIQSVAEVSFGADRGTRVWTFLCPKLEIQGGGHRAL